MRERHRRLLVSFLPVVDADNSLSCLRCEDICVAEGETVLCDGAFLEALAENALWLKFMEEDAYIFQIRAQMSSRRLDRLSSCDEAFCQHSVSAIVVLGHLEKFSYVDRENA